MLGPTGTMKENLRVELQLVRSYLHSLQHAALLPQVPTGTNWKVAELSVDCTLPQTVARPQEPIDTSWEHSAEAFS